MAEVRPDEISAILRKQLSGFESEVDVYDVGTVLQVGDGIARVYGLSKVMASELVEFPNDVIGMVLNLDEDSVGCVLFGESQLVKEGDTVKISINLRGREWTNPQGETKYFNSIQGWRIEKLETGAPEGMPPVPPMEAFEPANDLNEEDHDDLPF